MFASPQRLCMRVFAIKLADALVDVLAETAVRRRFWISDGVTADGYVAHFLHVGNDLIGLIVGTPIEGGFRIRAAEINNRRYRGLGLGKKAYGELIRRYGAIHSDRSVSDEAGRVWRSLWRNRKNYQVSVAGIDLARGAAIDFENWRPIGRGFDRLRHPAARDTVFTARLRH
jgi:hypothetical protein